MAIILTKDQAKNIWINSQGLQTRAFGKGVKAVDKTVEHLGYVQIDTINVIERCHHHILYNRIPDYKREFLQKAQSTEKSIFEYWTHALSYVSVKDYPYFVNLMQKTEKNPGPWFSTVTSEDMKKVFRILKQEGPISIRDIKDDVLVEKTHDWASKKPSKRALQLGFYCGYFVVSERQGMLKKYDLTERHFGWEKRPKSVSEDEYLMYIIERGLRSQGVISVDSVTHLDSKRKIDVQKKIDNLVKNKKILPVKIKDLEKFHFWISADSYEKSMDKISELTHILSPFDPLVIQRKRLKMLFDYEHIFEAYVPKDKRKFGYFSLPVLHENRIVALLDLKTDRESSELIIQSWHWIGKNKSKENKKLIEMQLDRFEKFQLAK